MNTLNRPVNTVHVQFSSCSVHLFSNDHSVFTLCSRSVHVQFTSPEQTRNASHVHTVTNRTGKPKHVHERSVPHNSQAHLSRALPYRPRRVYRRVYRHTAHSHTSISSPLGGVHSLTDPWLSFMSPDPPALPRPGPVFTLCSCSVHVQFTICAPTLNTLVFTSVQFSSCSCSVQSEFS